MIWRTAWRHMGWLDWIFLGLLGASLFLPTTGAAVPPTPAGIQPMHPGTELGTLWPTVRPITLNPEISLGNVLSLLGMVLWVGRWGAKTITVVNELPDTLSRINKRLRRLEVDGCSQFEQHRNTMGRIERSQERSQERHEHTHEIPDEDLKGEGCLK